MILLSKVKKMPLLGNSNLSKQVSVQRQGVQIDDAEVSWQQVQKVLIPEPDLKKSISSPYSFTSWNIVLRSLLIKLKKIRPDLTVQPWGSGDNIYLSVSLEKTSSFNDFGKIPDALEQTGQKYPYTSGGIGKHALTPIYPKNTSGIYNQGIFVEFELGKHRNNVQLLKALIYFLKNWKT
jgi:hypothetical protein